MSEYDEIIKLGIISVIIIGRELQIVANRADELGITEICQSVSDKQETLNELQRIYRFYRGAI